MHLLGCCAADLAPYAMHEPCLIPPQTAKILHSLQVAFSEAELAELRRELQEQEQLIRGYQVSKAGTCAGRNSQRCLQQNCQLVAFVWVGKRDADCSACCFVLSLISVTHAAYHDHVSGRSKHTSIACSAVQPRNRVPQGSLFVQPCTGQQCIMQLK